MPRWRSLKTLCKIPVRVQEYVASKSTSSREELPEWKSLVPLKSGTMKIRLSMIQEYTPAKSSSMLLCVRILMTSRWGIFRSHTPQSRLRWPARHSCCRRRSDSNVRTNSWSNMVVFYLFRISNYHCFQNCSGKFVVWCSKIQFQSPSPYRFSSIDTARVPSGERQIHKLAKAHNF